MKYINKIIGVLEIIAGVIFLISIASDIQLGFGLILLFMGIKDVLK